MTRALLLTLVLLAWNAEAASAQDASLEDSRPPAQLFDSGRLLATGGVSNVEGAGGGGLATWALITGYGSRDAIGVNAHYTFVETGAYHLQTFGVSTGLYDRVELSYARMAFDTRAVGAALGLGYSYTFNENVFGAKVKVLGDAVFDQDHWLPQVSAGVQYKTNDRGAIIQAVGGKSDHGTDLYVAATKLLLGESLLLDATLRETKANQFGILGFGGDKDAGYRTEVEASAAVLLSRRLAIGAEYRTKPDNLSFAHESNAFDIFAAFFLNKHISATLAYVALGDIALQKNQNGVYLSLQAGF